MRSPKKNNKPQGEHWATVEAPTVSDWEAAHIFLEVARSGSFRAAAQKLRQSVNALRRRVHALEQDLGVSLLIRHVNGVRLTDEGSKIYAAVQQMESASFNLLQARNVSEKQIEGEVRLSITEGMGIGWLLPQLAEFQRANPRLVMNLRCESRAPDLLRLEADIAVQLQRPNAPDLKVVKLGCLHMMFFAAKSYIDTHGYPTNVSDFAKHRFAVLSNDAGSWEGFYRNFFPQFSPTDLVVLRNNVSTGHYWSVVQGMGIGALPTYVQAIGADLVPLEINPKVKIDIWLTYRSEAKRIARIRKTIDWLIQAYDPRRFPWFREEFIHPSRFPELYKGSTLTSPLTAVRAR
ncbi:MAG TPA: LysR family transcriptional regulator [Rhizomicrobium sp.]|nr:LysR family transcriptional regulator [Rhizomicrobium sp.]